MEEKISEICSGYEKIMFNCDETGLFFRAIPLKQWLKNGKCTREKIPKRRLTVVLCINMMDEFEKPVIIHKTANIINFKGTDNENKQQQQANVTVTNEHRCGHD